jgi:UrcA family protein
MRIYNATILATLMATTPAMAGQAADHRQERVSYTDINTASMAGMLVLRGRIQAASRTLCGSEPDLRDLNRREPYRSCVTQSVQQALDEIPKGSLASR